MGDEGQVAGPVRGRFVYVSGPQTSSGDRIQNMRTAIDAAQSIRDAGGYPFVPHVHDLWDLLHPTSWREWIRFDLAWLGRCHALLRLPGVSRVPNVEVRFAERIGIPVYHQIGDLLAALRQVIAAEDAR